MSPAEPESDRFTHWLPTIEAIAQRPGLVMVIGASDCGKTTWVRFAAKALHTRLDAPIAIVDADLGQSTFGPPATVGLYIAAKHSDIDRDAEHGAHEALSFVGSVTPLGHVLQTLTATHRLAKKAQQTGANIILVDTSGLISGSAGVQLKLRKTEILEPRHVVALQREVELEPLLSIISGRPGMQIHRLSVPAGIRRRLPPERAAYRAHRFAAYFSDATSLLLATDSLLCLPPPFPRRRGSFLLPPVLPFDRLPPHAIDELTGSLVGLNDAADDTLGLGILERVSLDRRTLALYSPAGDVSSVKIIQFSHLRLNPPCSECSSEVW